MIIFHIVTPFSPPSPPVPPTPRNRRLLVRFLCTSWTDYIIHNEGASFESDSCFSQFRGRFEVAVKRSVILLHIAISNLGLQAGSITLSRQAASPSTSQKLLRVLRNSKVHYLVHKSPPLSQINPAQDPHSCSWKSNFNIILAFTPKSSTRLFPPDFPIKSLYVPLSLSSYVPHFPLSWDFFVVFLSPSGRMSKTATN